MSFRRKWLDLTLLSLILLVLVGVPLAIKIYDRQVWKERSPSGAKEFTLTGHAQRGWILGEVQASEAVSLWQANGPVENARVRLPGEQEFALTDRDGWFSLRTAHFQGSRVRVSAGKEGWFNNAVGGYSGSGTPDIHLPDRHVRARAMVLPSLLALLLTNAMLKLYLG